MIWQKILYINAHLNAIYKFWKGISPKIQECEKNSSLLEISDFVISHGLEGDIEALDAPAL